MSDLKHNINCPFPVSYDGTAAVKCDKWGIPNPKGRWITWQILLPNDTFPSTKIAKLFDPLSKIKALDYAEMRKLVDNEPRFNPKLSKYRAKMQAKITAIYGRLGIAYTDALNSTSPSKEIDTACWGVTHDGKEFILINPYMLMFKRQWASYLLQHECMHKAFYRGRENMSDQFLKNVVLDICINRILAATPSGKQSSSWLKFCEWVYPPESKKSVLALCNASLTKKDLNALERVNPAYVIIWKEIYEKEKGYINVGVGKKGKPKKKKIEGMLSFKIKDLSPDDLYFRLKRQLTKEDLEALKSPLDGGSNPFGQRTKAINAGGGHVIKLRDEINHTPPEQSNRIENALRKMLVPKRFRGIAWRQFSDCRTEWWDKHLVDPKDIHDEDLDKYVRKIRTNKIMDNVVGRVTEAFKIQVVNQIYPYHLSEDGILLASLGFHPPHFPFYQNLNGPEGKRRVIVMFDLSPSTYYFWPYMAYMTDAFEDYMDITFARNAKGDPGVMTFAGSIKMLSRKELNAMKKGELEVGYSTCFDSVIEYCNEEVKTKDVDTLIIFTDGESDLSDTNADEFNRSGKRAFRIYMNLDDKNNPSRGKPIESSLDKLNGTSYTLLLRRSDALELVK